MKSSSYKPWPKDGKPAHFGSDILPALRRALRFAYELKRINKGKSIPWNGLDIGETEKAGCLTPKIQLRAERLEYSENDQGRDALDEILGLAVRLGIEQGRRMERTSTIRSLIAMQVRLSGFDVLNPLIDRVVKALTGSRRKFHREKAK